jgi:uncharacterized protein (DUF1015 family)
MANILPFQPYRYTAKAGPLENVVTQPYDKITPEMRERYLELSPYNLVRVILGKPPEPGAPENVYQRAARLFREWIAEGILARDPEPGLYPYSQEFAVPETGEVLVRKGFIGLGPVEEYSKGIVYRHEQTLTGPKQDRLELLRHTRAHFGQLFMLYPDPAGEVDRLLDEAAAAGPPVEEVRDEYLTIHRVWKISDPARIGRITEAMRDKRLLIADGHHRYETALAFRNEHPDLEAARSVMMTFVNMHSPGLRILATHRVVRNLREFSPDAFLARVREYFHVDRLDSLEALRRAWAEEHLDSIRIGVALTGGALYLLDAPRAPNVLDVRFLHEGVLDAMLGFGEADIREERHLTYVRGLEAAADEVWRRDAHIAFLLEPVPIGEVARIAFNGGVMPQKSTDFYPKLLSGLTIYAL